MTPPATPSESAPPEVRSPAAESSAALPAKASASAQMPAEAMRPAARIAILASGAGTTAEAIIVACAPDGSTRRRIDAEPAIVIGNNSSAEVFARSARLGVPTRHLSSVTHPDPDELDAAILDSLRQAGATFVVLAGYMRKLGPRTLAACAGRIVNTHPALLPQFGGQGMYGARVHKAVLDAGVPVTGATVHYVDAEYDTGRVIAQATVPVQPGDTVESLAARVQVVERELLVSTLAALVAESPSDGRVE